MNSPAFQFYSSDWLSSRTIRLMDAEQRGWYIQLLAEAWESKPQATLPDDDVLLRTLAGVNTCSTDVEQRWNFVKSRFKKRGSVVYNERQMEEVVRQEVNRKKKSEAGKASAEARRVERETIKVQHLRDTKRGNRRSTPVEIVLPSCTNTTSTESNSSLSSSSSLSISPSEEKKERHAKPRDDRVDHPALQAVREIRGQYPSKDVWDLIIKTVGVEPDVGRMRECWLAWRGRDFRPNNLGWLTDWYVSGIPGGSNGSNQPRYESAPERNVRNLRENAAYIRSLSNSDGEVDREDPIGLLTSGV